MALLNLHFIGNFIRHYLQATPIDVLHSPFVFACYNKCIKPTDNDEIISSVEARRNNLLADNSPLHYADHGASANSRNVKVSELARTHLKPRRLATILYRLCKDQQPKTVLELGTSLGITTSYLAMGAGKDARIITIEGAPEVYKQANKTFEKLSISNIDARCGTFDEVLPNLLSELKQLDLVYIDGNHSEEATLRYFNMVKPLLHNNSLVVFDDIYWSKGMTRAWEAIKADPGVQVTVDLFFLGLVFFRQEQARQHFRLRII